ncbi:MAG: putative quinol monooxygenase [Thermoanaerobaculia bacterium]
MASDTLRVVAILLAKPDKVSELGTTLAGLLEPTRAEPGCISYELLQNKENEAEFTFVEEWESDSALDAHFATDHIQQAIGEFPNLMAAELDLRKYKLVG